MNKPIQSAIRDNHQRGTVGNFISEHLSEGCSLSFVSAFFTIYAYNQLKNKLDNIQDLRFLFGEPRFISQIDPKTDKKQFQIEDDKLVIPIENRLTQVELHLSVPIGLKKNVKSNLWSSQISYMAKCII